MNEVFLVRHPRAAVPRGVCYGRTDVPLAEDPEALARAVRAALPVGARIVSSPARRCLAVAERLGAHAVDERLREIDFGDWEMRSYADIGAEALNLWAADTLGFRPPGGETVAEMAARVLAVLDAQLQAISGNCGCVACCLVTHGGPMRVIAGSLLGLPASAWVTLDFRVGAYSRLRRDIDGWRLVEHNIRPVRADRSAPDAVR